MEILYFDLLWIERDNRRKGYANILLQRFIDLIKNNYSEYQHICLIVSPSDNRYQWEFADMGYVSWDAYRNQLNKILKSFYFGYGFKSIMNNEMLLKLW